MKLAEKLFKGLSSSDFSILKFKTYLGFEHWAAKNGNADKDILVKIGTEVFKNPKKALASFKNGKRK